ncbi:hypothetical protein A2482_01855 [Candidatus Falkowbacteria bacterium RIFOXYC2_FULL_48_21]|uniref:Radical SAM core domain-containing protein n=1 Tax=Candidatus Falkowbacteria bacterium RIFOXYC2_FULL_48_21 TaxID=1798005 RepID=A0A1F5TFJ7_9BACT|nr:MAG: hypothetical protein A2482_01855 [Candidatus Falkowbacteria bacterium RIFOXYC2_FULL_48_21]
MEFAIRVTDHCNLNCQYCYARVAKPKNMSVETLDRALTEVAGLSEEPVTISWTGGEPLTMGHEFFESIARIQSRLGSNRFTNILQSNLILLDAHYMRFLIEQGFQVRTSLDLPPENHDALRRAGDFARALCSVVALKSAGVPVNVNTVVTGRNIDRPEEIFAFLKSIGITSFSVSRLVEQGNATNHPEFAVYDNAAFGQFLVKLFDCWIADKEKPLIERITPLDKLLAACRRGSRDEKAKCFHCQSQMFAIGPDGAVFPSCNKFFALIDTCLGNIYETSLRSVIDSEARRKFLVATSDVSNRVCGECEYVDYCEGGCYYIAHTARVKGEDMHTRERFCKGYYLVFERILRHLKEARS